MPSSCAVSTVQVRPFSDEPAPLSGAQMMAANPYRPWPARITSITDLTATEKLFEFRLIDERIRDAFSHEPGQFVEVSIFGVGEAPLSISSSPSKRGFIELCVRRTGHFTEVLHKMQCGDIVGLRGPFGRGFPFEDMKGHDILLVAGGLGIGLVRGKLNPGFLGQLLQGFAKIQAVDATVKVEDVPRCLAAETIESALFLIDGKRGLGLLVERAGGHQARAHRAHLYIASRQIGDADAGLDGLDGVGIPAAHACMPCGTLERARPQRKVTRVTPSPP